MMAWFKIRSGVPENGNQSIELRPSRRTQRTKRHKYVSSAKWDTT